MSAVKHQPATPLPWRSTHPMKLDDSAPRHGLVRIDAGHFPSVAQMVEYDKRNAVPVQDARYIAHAANAYPKLVEALRAASRELWQALGGGDDDDCRTIADARCKRFDSLLRELGEDA